MVVTCPKCGTVINRKEWDEVKNKWKEGKFYKIMDPELTDLKRHGRPSETTRREKRRPRNKRS